MPRYCEVAKAGIAVAMLQFNVLANDVLCSVSNKRSHENWELSVGL
jgi:hypothetical protein